MLWNACCTLCLSVKRKTVNVYNTNLQHLYEKLADSKVKDACWMCYICHTKLQQCHQLQQLAVQTRGLIDHLRQNKTNDTSREFKPIVELSLIETQIISSSTPFTCTDQSLESPSKSPDLKSVPSTENEYDGDLKEYKQHWNKLRVDQFHRNRSNYKFDDQHSSEYKPILTLTDTSCVRQSLTTHSVAGEYLVERRGQVAGNTEVTQIKLEVDRNEEEEDHTEDRQHWNEPCEDQYKCNMSNFIFDNQHNAVYIPTSSITDPCVRQSPKTHLATGEYLMEGREQIAGNTAVTQMIKFEVPDVDGNGIAPDKRRESEQDNTNDSEERDDVMEPQFGWYKRPFTCSVCSRTFIYKAKFLEHVRVHTGEKPFTCDMCSKTFARKDVLKAHILIHNGGQPFSCDICQKKFSYKNVLKNHMKTHTGERPFSCDVCLKSFARVYNLREHMRTHDAEKVYYNCHICSKQLISKRYLKIHIRQHLEEQQYSCNICLKKFVFKTSLSTHIKTHSSDKRFGCNVCPLRFKTKSNLHRHLRTHGGDKPFSCDFCSRKFLRKQDLTDHTRTHTGEKPYSCDFCQKGFTRMSNLRVHLKTHT